MSQICRGLRFTCLILALGCSSVVYSANTLVFWNNQQSADVVVAISKGFTKKSGIAVDVNWISQSDYKSSLLRHSLDGDLPDVALVPGDFLSMAKELKLSEIPSSVQSAGLIPTAAEGGLYEEKMMGAPVIWGNHLMLFYNRDMIKTPAKTFAELEVQAVELRQKGVKPFGMNFGEMYWLVPFLGAYGGWPLDKQGNITLNSKAMAQALDFYYGLANKGLTEKKCRTDCIHERFSNGEFAYTMAGDWGFKDFEEKMGNKFGVTLLPMIDNKPLVSMFSSYVLVFPNNGLAGPKREALLKFIKYMQSVEVQRRWANEGKLFPVVETVFKEVTAKADTNTKASLEQLRLARAMPNERNMAFAWEGMAKGFSGRYNGRISSEDAALLMQAHALRVAQRAGQ